MDRLTTAITRNPNESRSHASSSLACTASHLKDRKMEKKLQVWWIPQVPMTEFTVDVPDINTACLILKTLADYDQFQLDNNIKPDYANAGGLNEWDEDEEDWVTWYDPNTGMDIDEHMDFVDAK